MKTDVCIKQDLKIRTPGSLKWCLFSSEKWICLQKLKAQTSYFPFTNHPLPFDNELLIILWITGFDLHFSRGQLWRELQGIIAFPHRAWGLSVILTDMSFQGKKMHQIGSPDKSWQTNQTQTEIRLFNLRTVSHSDEWWALQVTPCQADSKKCLLQIMSL